MAALGKPLDEQALEELDVVFCERGSTQAVKHKLGRGRIHHVVVRGARVSVVADDAMQPVRPFVVRYHMEPWPTNPADGVDLGLECKSALHPPNVPGLHLPYLYASFTHRTEPAEVLARSRRAPLPVQATPKGQGNWPALDGEQRWFAALLTSYCSARVRSAFFRSVFFNALAARFPGTGGASGERPMAIGNCQPREAQRPLLRLKPAPDLVQPNMFAAAVAAFSRFRFGIAFENSQVPGYITEKIVNVWLAGAVPIYWGAPDVARVLNPAAFVHCDVKTAGVVDWDAEFRRAEAAADGKDKGAVLAAMEGAVLERLGGDAAFATCLEQIAYLEQNRTAYLEMVSQPLVLGGLRGSVVDPELYAREISALMAEQRAALKAVE